MLKITGAIMIVAATSTFGFNYATKLRKRTKQLRDLKTALQILKAEIIYGLTPLAQATEHIAGQVPKPVSNFFSELSSSLKKGKTEMASIFKNALDQTWNLTSLKKAEYEIIEQFGKTLGLHDSLSQQKHIEIACAHLERIEKEAHLEQINYEKMAKTLGVLSGILIVFILL